MPCGLGMNCLKILSLFYCHPTMILLVSYLVALFDGIDDCMNHLVTWLDEDNLVALISGTHDWMVWRELPRDLA